MDFKNVIIGAHSITNYISMVFRIEENDLSKAEEASNQFLSNMKGMYFCVSTGLLKMDSHTWSLLNTSP